MPESTKDRVLQGLTAHREQRELYPLFVAIQADLSALVAQFNQLRTDFNAHVHGGVTAGAANTAATTATAAVAVARQTNP